jgi:Fe-S cluster assembly protein SufD
MQPIQTDSQEASSVFVERFRALEGAWSQNGSSWFVERRREAIDRFTELGLPTMRDEAWKYTNVARLKKHAFRCELGTVDEENLGQFAIEGLDATHLVFVDGAFCADLSSVDGLADGVVVESLASALSARREQIEPRLSRQAEIDSHAFVALNTALAEDGAYVHVAKNTDVSRPIHLQFIATAKDAPLMAHPRILIDVERGARVTVIEDYVALHADAVYFDNVVTEIFVAENAHVAHYKLQRESSAAFHVATIAVELAASSVFVSSSFSFGGALVRNDIDAILAGEGVECTLDGLVVGADKQHTDNHTRIVHAKPHSHSWELYKSVLDDKAHSVFNGKIYVAEDAQKTDAKQTNQSLLLSDTAAIDTKPELEIYADDVKCTHGATVGQLDKESLFYLRSRGIDAQSARDLLIYAFASDVVEHVKIEPLRKRIEELVFAKLPKSGLLESSH